MGFWNAYKETSKHGVSGYMASKEKKRESESESIELEKRREAALEPSKAKAHERRVELKKMKFGHEGRVDVYYHGNENKPEGDHSADLSKVTAMNMRVGHGKGSTVKVSTTRLGKGMR